MDDAFDFCAKKACWVQNRIPCLATGALRNISGHLWYLNEELVMLALFDDSGQLKKN